ncbi:hypothetical protein BH23GEM8_BH23GEM8_20340 [soil metagenome]
MNGDSARRPAVSAVFGREPGRSNECSREKRTGRLWSSTPCVHAPRIQAPLMGVAIHRPRWACLARIRRAHPVPAMMLARIAVSEDRSEKMLIAVIAPATTTSPSRKHGAPAVEHGHRQQLPHWAAISPPARCSPESTAAGCAVLRLKTPQHLRFENHAPFCSRLALHARRIKSPVVVATSNGNRRLSDEEKSAGSRPLPVPSKSLPPPPLQVSAAAASLRRPPQERTFS